MYAVSSERVDVSKSEHPMPVTYRFDFNIIVIEPVGEYTMGDLRAAMLNSLGDANCPVNAALLINLVESRSIHKRTSEDIRTMAHFIGSLKNRFNNRLALVAFADLPFGLMRMGSVELERTGISSEVFRTFAEAQEWLLHEPPLSHNPSPLSQKTAVLGKERAAS